VARYNLAGHQPSARSSPAPTRASQHIARRPGQGEGPIQPRHRAQCARLGPFNPGLRARTGQKQTDANKWVTRRTPWPARKHLPLPPI